MGTGERELKGISSRRKADGNQCKVVFVFSRFKRTSQCTRKPITVKNQYVHRFITDSGKQQSKAKEVYAHTMYKA